MANRLLAPPDTSCVHFTRDRIGTVLVERRVVVTAQPDQPLRGERIKDDMSAWLIHGLPRSTLCIPRRVTFRGFSRLADRTLAPERLGTSSLFLCAEAVAQTPGGRAGAVPRVGSEKSQLDCSARRVRPGAGAATRSSTYRSDRGAGDRRHLCATPSTRKRKRDLVRDRPSLPMKPGAVPSPAPGSLGGAREQALSYEPLGGELHRRGSEPPHAHPQTGSTLTRRSIPIPTLMATNMNTVGTVTPTVGPLIGATPAAPSPAPMS